MPKAPKSKPRNQGSRPGKPKSKSSQTSRSMQKVQQPLTNGNISRKSEPSQRMNQNGSVVIKHKEFVKDLIGQGVPFSLILQAGLNPGNQFLFPWLSAIASRYESYRFRKVIFHFNTSCSTVTPGYIAITTDYNYGDPAVVDKVHMMQYANTVKGPPWQNFSVALSKENLAKRKSYFVCDPMIAIGEGGLPSNTADPTLYFTGRSMVAVGGQDGQSIIGDLWVEYEVELMTPEIANAAELLFTGVKVDSNTAKGSTNTQPLKGATVAQVTNQAQTVTEVASQLGNQIQFLQKFRGIINTAYAGTGITAVPTGAGIRAHADTTWTDEENVLPAAYSSINAAGTLGTSFIEVNAKAGDILAGWNSLFTGTTCTSAALRFSAYESVQLL
jgi:hypothetical protein